MYIKGKNNDKSSKINSRADGLDIMLPFDGSFSKRPHKMELLSFKL